MGQFKSKCIQVVTQNKKELTKMFRLKDIWHVNSKVYLSLLFIFLISCLTSPPVKAVGGLLSPELNPTIINASTQRRFKSGFVAAKGIVRTPEGNPIFAEYNENGELVQEIAEAEGEYKDAYVISAIAYNSYVSSYNKIVSEQGDENVTVLYRSEYIGKSFTWLDGYNHVGVETDLLKDTKSVVVLNEDRVLNDSSEHILLKTQINLKSIRTLRPEEKSLLLNENGDVLYISEHNIGYRVAYMTKNVPNGSGASVGSSSNDKNSVFGTDIIGKGSLKDHTVWNPISGAVVERSPSFRTTTTDSTGFYSFSYYIPSCPCQSGFYPGAAIASVQFDHFNPRRRYPGRYYAWREYDDFCSNYSACIFPGAPGLNAHIAGIEATTAISVFPVNIPIDAAMLTGSGIFKNDYKNESGQDTTLVDVTVGSETKYDYTPAENKPKIPKDIDFNGDGEADKFVCKHDGTIGVYFGDLPDGVIEASPGSVCEPAAQQPANPEDSSADINRLADFDMDLVHQGLLKNISESDFKNTDIYVYRVSKDQLITQKKGLIPEEYISYEHGEIYEGAAYFQMLVRGGHSYDLLTKGLVDWQVKTGVNQELHGTQADHLRPGEKIKIIMVNRATGYIGTKILDYDVKSRSDGGVSTGITIGDGLPIEMMAPNLKIKAERKYLVEFGLTKDEEREYLIGFEGSGLISDEVIAITTEWYDHDGSPLPPDLPGYTGRIAKVVQQDTLGNSRIANFSIKPGTHTQLVQLPQRPDIAHYYVHVSGAAIEDEVDFSVSGNAGEGLLQYRPDHYVPIKVPVYDEVASIKLEQAVEEDEDVDAVYRWVYRPEMQFSLFDFEVEELNRHIDQNNISNLLESSSSNEASMVSSEDLMLEAIYSILEPVEGENSLSMLESFGPDRELVLSIGGTEVLLTIDENKKIEFQDLDFINKIDPNELLSIQLYQNGDDQNILWEFAFGQHIVVPSYDSEIEVSADDPYVEVFSNVYLGESSEEYINKNIFWNVEGDGDVDQQFQRKSTGNYNVVYSLPVVANSSGKVIAAFESPNNSKVESSLFKVVPGVPASISTTQSGKTAISKLGKIELEITVTDQHGNTVKDGTPVIITDADVFLDGDLYTTDGIVNVDVYGGGTAGTKELKIYAGEVEKTVQLEVHDLSLTWSFPAEVNTRKSVSATLTVSSPESEFSDLSGLNVNVSAFRGHLDESWVTLDSSNQAQIEYYSGKYPGSAQLYARVGETLGIKEFEVVSEYDNVSLSADVLVGDANAGGSFDVEYDGQQIPVRFEASSEISIEGDPNEFNDISLGNIAYPPIEPVIEYRMDRVGSLGGVEDSFQGINGVSENIIVVHESDEGFDNSYEFEYGAVIRVPNATELNKGNMIGFGLKVKPSPTTGSIDDSWPGFTIVEYDARPQLLRLNSEKKFEYQIETENGVFTVQSDPVNFDEWYEVGVVYKEDKITLEVNGVKYESAATGTIIENSSSTTALQIGYLFEGLINDFRVNDWTKPFLISFEDGSITKNIQNDENGLSTISIISTGQQTPQFTRVYNKMRREYFAQIENETFFAIKPAFADEPNNERSLLCSQEAPPGLSGVAYFDYFLEYYTECYIPDKLDEIKIEIDKHGVLDKELYVALADYATYKSLYVLAMGAKSLVSAVNCADGFLFGGSGTATHMVCDFISGFFLYGDLRDFMMHFYHRYIGDEKKFDYATYALAGVGIITNLIEVAGFFAGGVPGVIAAGVDGVVSGSRTAAKVFRKFPKMTRILGMVLDKKILEGASVSAETARRISKFLPFLEIFCAIALYQNELWQVVDLLGNAIKTSEDVERWANVLYRYMEWYEDKELNKVEITDNGSAESPLSYIVKPAHASALPLVREPIEKLCLVLREVAQAGGERSLKVVGEKLNEVIGLMDEAIEASKNDPEKYKELMEILFEKETFVAFQKVTQKMGKEGAAKLRNFAGSKTVSHADLFKYVSELPLDKFTPDQLKGLHKVFSDLQSVFNKSHGAANEIKVIYYALNGPVKKAIKGIQVEREIINAAGEVIQKRVDDIVEEIVDTGVTVFGDSKAWAPDKINDFIKRSLKRTPGKEIVDEAGNAFKKTDYGQLFRDIVWMSVNNDPTKKLKWFFDYRNIGNIDNIKNAIIKNLKDPKIGRDLNKQLRLLPEFNVDDWIDVVDDQLSDLFDDFIEVIPKEV